MAAQGFLAIWCEIAPEHRVDYRNWLTQEHIADRMYSPGFMGVRLFSSLDNEGAHFILYATESPAVMQSATYLHILNHPSPWTQRIMVKFGPFDRAAGERVVKIGHGFGAYVLACRLRTDGRALDPVQARDALRALIHLPDTIGVRLLRNVRETTGLPSVEKTLRQGDEGAFDYLLVVEAMQAQSVLAARAALADVLPRAVPGLVSYDSLACQMRYGEAPYEGETP